MRCTKLCRPPDLERLNKHADAGLDAAPDLHLLTAFEPAAYGVFHPAAHLKPERVDVFAAAKA